MQIQIFGAFRRYTDQPWIALEFEGAMVSVVQVRDAFKAYARANWPDCDDRLIDASAFATDSQILQNADEIDSQMQLSILPPVSGG